MAWQDKLQTGSFRGVEFVTESVSNSIGRRSQLHEYPHRDKPYIEDLGKKAREHSFECFVIGDDYMQLRDNLVEALEKKGAGTLIHPYWGTQTVQVLTVNVSESSSEGRLARFSISFSEAGSNDNPAEKVDTATVLSEKVDGGIIATINDFTAKFGVAGLPDFAVTDSISLINSAMDVIAVGQSSVAAVNDVRANITNAINNPLELAMGITGAIAANANLPVLKELHGFGQELVTLSQITPNQILQARNRSAIISIVRRTAALETARLLL